MISNLNNGTRYCNIYFIFLNIEMLNGLLFYIFPHMVQNPYIIIPLTQYHLFIDVIFVLAHSHMIIFFPIQLINLG